MCRNERHEFSIDDSILTTRYFDEARSCNKMELCCETGTAHGGCSVDFANWRFFTALPLVPSAVLF